MANYSDYVERIKTYLRISVDDLPQLDMDECITAAVDEHSDHRPYVQYHVVTGDASDPADYDLHADFIWDWSDILELEYPTGNNPRSLLEVDDYEIWYDGPNTKYQIRFLSAKPTATETYQMKFTSRHDTPVDRPAADTIPAQDFNAVCMLSASYCYHSLAAKFTQTQDPTMNQDIINYHSKGEEYNSLAAKMRRLYFRSIGKSDEPMPEVAIATKDWDSEFAGQVDYLTHPKNWR
jgi:hypothetical protein